MLRAKVDQIEEENRKRRLQQDKLRIIAKTILKSIGVHDVTTMKTKLFDENLTITGIAPYFDIEIKADVGHCFIIAFDQRANLSANICVSPDCIHPPQIDSWYCLYHANLNAKKVGEDEDEEMSDFREDAIFRKRKKQ